MAAEGWTPLDQQILSQFIDSDTGRKVLRQMEQDIQHDKDMLAVNVDLTKDVVVGLRLQTAIRVRADIVANLKKLSTKE